MKQINVSNTLGLLTQKRVNHYNGISQQMGSFLQSMSTRRKLYRQFSRETDLYLSSRFNVFDYIKPDENRLSQIFRDLLDPEGPHGQGKTYLRLFLDEFSPRVKDFERFDPDEVLEVRCEYQTAGKRRIDLVISAENWVFGMENKPWAKDQELQVYDYLKELAGRYSRFALLYLSSSGNRPSEESIGSARALEMEEAGHLVIAGYSGPEMSNWLKASQEKSQSEPMRIFLKQLSGYIQATFSYS